MDSEHSASAAIRASIRGLPSRARRPWSSDDAANVFSVPPTGATWVAEADTPEQADHIALLASPDVAAALADLLDAIASDDRFPLYRWQERVDEARDALEDAILRSQT